MVARKKARRRATGNSEAEFRLLLSHDSFTDSLRDSFVSELAGLTGCRPSEIEILRVRSGCIVVRVRLPDHASKKFLALFHKYISENCNLDVCPQELRDFISQFKVDNFTRYVSDIDILVREKPKGRAIIFVHGWTGDESTFKQWPSFVWDEFRCPVEVFKYPSGKLSHSPPVIQLADALRNTVRNRFASKNIAFVAHSLGGIVVRRFVIASESGDDRLDVLVKNIVFIASPHNGHLLARLAEKVPFLRSKQLADLSSDSPFLHDLNSRWIAWTRTYVPGSCRVTSIYGSADPLVTSLNAMGLDPDAIPILGKSHMDIVKPDDPSDEIVQTVDRILRQSGFFEREPDSDVRGQRALNAFFKGSREPESAGMEKPFIEGPESSADLNPKSRPPRL